MRESVAAFCARGGRYAPPAALIAAHGARPLAPGDDCPTLFRAPGPHATRRYLAGAPEAAWLAPEVQPWLWLSERPASGSRRQAELFGVLAVLVPLPLQPCRVRPGQWIAENRLVPDEGLVWVPPSALRAAVPWDALGTRRAAEQALGAGLAEERRRVGERLDAYLEELSLLAAAGVPGPDRPWCDVPAAERRQILAAAGMDGRFSAGGRRR